MMLFSLIYVIYLFSSHVTLAKEEVDTSPLTCDDESWNTPPQPLARKNTSRQISAHLIGLFDVYEGSRCHLLRPGGMEQVMMTISVLENRLMKIGGNDTEIGFDIYDTCSNISTTLHHLIYALTEAKALLPACKNRWYVGVLGPKNPEIQIDVSSFLKSVDIPYIPLITTSLKEEIKAMTSVLLDLKWKVVAVFASTKYLEMEFHEEADRKNICIVSSMSMIPNERTDALFRMNLRDLTSKSVQVSVVLGSGINLRKLYEMVLEANSTIQYWLMAGVDAEEDILPILFSSDHPVILFKRPVERVPLFETSMKETYDFGDKIRHLNLVQSYIDYMESCKKDIAGNILNDSRCTDQLRHSILEKNIVDESIEKLFDDMTQAGTFDDADRNDTNESLIKDFDPKPTSIEIWTYQHVLVKFPKHKEVLVGHYDCRNRHLYWDKKILNIFRSMGSGWFKIPEFYCQQNCREVCSNYGNISLVADMDGFFSKIYHWKHETWTNILLTISCVGVLIASLTIIFLICNSCRDFDEGSQALNVTVLVSIMLAYSCTILFMFHKDIITCYKRLAAVGVAYVLILAPILSRCFLLVAAEMDGIHAHVSGFLQFVLYFFVAAPQIAMAVYYWFSQRNIVSSGYKCIFDVKTTIGYLSYSMLLSCIWLIVSPFCARSRRNNREGLLYHFGSVAVCIVWLTWFLLFFLLHPRWNEFTICFGIVVTATAVLVVIYIPRVYKIIVSTAGKQHGQVSMQPVIFASTSSRSPNLSIYESVDHGFNPDKDGFVVGVFRDDDESPGRRKMTHL